MQKITPFITYNDQAEEAVNLYTSIFKNARITNTSRSADGSLFSAEFEIDGQEFIALNGGPYFKFSEGISLFVHCETQAEVDELWEKLSAGGEKGRCGWLTDKFGVSWQIVPDMLGKLMQDSDPEKANRVTQALMQMGKIEIADLLKAYDGK